MTALALAFRVLCSNGLSVILDLGLFISVTIDFHITFTGFKYFET